MKHRSLFASSLALFAGGLVAASCSSGTPPATDPTNGTVDGGGQVDHFVPPDSADAPVVLDAPGDVIPDINLPDAPTNCSPDAGLNGNETDVGCGGPCPPCGTGAICRIGPDCVSGVCPQTGAVHHCAQAACNDNIKNGTETDVDCGGTLCPPCGDNKVCVLPRDCVSLHCNGNNQCEPASCNDNIKNGTESDIDCGGQSCPKCRVGLKCNNVLDCVSNACNVTCLCPTAFPGMTIIPSNGTKGGDYCVDSMEVSKEAYSTFLATNPSLANQIPACTWNTTYTPTNDWPPNLTQAFWTGGDPVRYVDWCDAYAYCKANGKRLCGHMDDGALNPPSAYKDKLQSEWYNACSAQGQNMFPYGQAWKTYCQAPPSVAPDNGDRIWAQYDSNHNSNVNMQLCNGGTPGLLNMSGDVAEWENSCNGVTGASDTCLTRGGDFTVDAQATSTQVQCDALSASARDTTSATIGFRCCI